MRKKAAVKKEKKKKAAKAKIRRPKIKSGGKSRKATASKPVKIEESARRELSEKELIEMLSPKREMDLKIQKTFEELPEKFSIMLLERFSEYSIINARIVKYLTGKNMKGVYLTVNKSLADLVETFAGEEIKTGNVIFIDAITKLTGDSEVKGENFHYVDSPRDMVDISIAVENAVSKLGEGKKFVIVDSLTTLLVYNKETTVERFVHAVSGKMYSLGARTIFILMESTEEGVKNTLAQFCDKVITI